MPIYEMNSSHDITDVSREDAKTAKWKNRV